MENGRRMKGMKGWLEVLKGGQESKGSKARSAD